MKEEHTHWYRECTTLEWGRLKLKSHIRDASKALEYNILKRHESNEMQTWKSYPGMSEIIKIARDIVENNNKKDVDKLANMIKVHECQQSAVVEATIALIVGSKIGSNVDIDEEIKDKIRKIELWNVPLIKDKNGWPQRKIYSSVYEDEEDEEDDENDDADTKEEGVEAEEEGDRNDTNYMPVITADSMTIEDPIRKPIASNPVIRKKGNKDSDLEVKFCHADMKNGLEKSAAGKDANTYTSAYPYNHPGGRKTVEECRTVKHDKPEDNKISELRLYQMVY